MIKQLKYGTFESVNGINLSTATDADKHIKTAYALLDTAIKNNKTGFAAWTYWPPNAETYAWSNIESLYYGQMSIKDYMNNLQKEAEKDKAKNNLFKFNNILEGKPSKL